METPSMTDNTILQPMIFNTMFQPENGVYGSESANTHGIPTEYMDFEYDLGNSHHASKLASDTVSELFHGYSILANEYKSLPDQTGTAVEDGIRIDCETETMNTNDELDFDYEIERTEPPMLPGSSHKTTLSVQSLTKNQGVAKRLGPVGRKQTTCPLRAKPMLQRVLLQHIRTVHRTQQFNSQAAALRCSQCPETFARKDNLERHQAEQHGDKSGTVECPGCKAQVRFRALDSHLKSRKCRETELEMDLALLRSQRKSWAASLDDPGRFDESTAVDPLFVATLYSAESVRRSGGTLSAAILKIRGLAIRAVSRGLEDPTEADSGPLAFALIWLAIGDSKMPSSEEDCQILRGFYLHFRALFALEKRFDRDLFNSSLLRPGAIGRAMIEYVRPEGYAWMHQENSDEDIDEIISDIRREALKELQLRADRTMWT